MNSPCPIIIELRNGGIFMANMYFNNEKKLEEVEDLLKVADKALCTSSPILTGKNSASAAVGAAIGGTIGAAIAGGGLAALGTGGAAVGGASLIGGSALAAGSAVLFAPIAIPTLLLGGIGYLLSKNKKEKELHNQRIAKYNKVVEKKNKIFEAYKKEKEKMEKDYERTKSENEDLKAKVREYELIFEALKKQREKFEKDLKVA